METLISSFGTFSTTLQKRLWEEYKNQDYNEQMNLRQFLATYKNKNRASTSNVLQYCRQFLAILQKPVAKKKLTHLRNFDSSYKACHLQYKPKYLIATSQIQTMIYIQTLSTNYKNFQDFWEPRKSWQTEFEQIKRAIGLKIWLINMKKRLGSVLLLITLLFYSNPPFHHWQLFLHP